GAARSRSGRGSGSSALREERVDALARLRGRRAQLAPGAGLRVLVGAAAPPLGARAGAVCPPLGVARPRQQLGPDACLLEGAGAPAVRLGRVPARILFDQREHLLGDARPRLRGDRGRADVVELAVLAVEAEQERGDVVTSLLPADPRDDAV